MDAEEQSFKFAQDVAKQVISLASAIPALMITFAKDFIGSVGLVAKWIAYGSWFFFLVSVLFGILTLMAMTGVLANRVKPAKSTNTDSPEPPKEDKGILCGNVRLFACVQILSFFAGLVLVVVFGWAAA